MLLHWHGYYFVINWHIMNKIWFNKVCNIFSFINFIISILLYIITFKITSANYDYSDNLFWHIQIVAFCVLSFTFIVIQFFKFLFNKLKWNYDLGLLIVGCLEFIFLGCYLFFLVCLYPTNEPYMSMINDIQSCC